jgi:mono/diheme cytochrome c family protein
MWNREREFLRPGALWIPILGLVFLTGGCAPNMSRQPKYKPLAGSDFFADGSTARPPVEGTVARGRMRADERFFTGKINGVLVSRLPLTVTRSVLERGRERYDIFCSPCHGRIGDGSGMVAQRGLRQPPSYHIDRLREAPDGHFFDVMTNGFGAMPSYASRIAVEDRWAITAYVRALQLSQAAKIQDVPPAERPKLLGTEK